MVKDELLIAIAENLANLFSVVDSTLDELCEIIPDVENVLMENHMNEVILGLCRRFNTHKFRLSNEVKIISLTTKSPEIIFGKPPRREISIYLVRTYEYLNDKKYMTALYYVCTNGCTLTSNVVQLLVNLGDTVGWDLLHSFAKRVDAKYGTNVLEKAIDVISKTRFRVVRYLSTLRNHGYVPVTTITELLNRAVHPASYGLEFRYFDEKGDTLEISRYHIPTTKVTITMYITEDAKYKIAQNVDTTILANAFDAWLSLYTYHNILYYKLFDALIVE